MRLFLYEYGSLPRREALPDSIRIEGQAMLNALREDARRTPGCEAMWIDAATPLDLEQERLALQSLARQADGCIVIAPEFSGLLETRCRWVEEAGGKWLGPSSSAVVLCGDKWHVYQHWVKRHVPTPRTWLPKDLPADLPPLLHKHRYGAGSLAIGMGLHPGHGSESPSMKDVLYQAFHPGWPASVSLLIGPDGWTLPLLPGEQMLSDEGKFQYRGGRWPLSPRLQDRAVDLARKAVAGIPGLLGYVGVDLILGEAEDGSNDAAIEINPRWTTSYLGLRLMTTASILELMLSVCAGYRPKPPRWAEAGIEITPAGQACPWQSGS